MNKPSIVQLDKHRQEGFRPEASLCLILDKKILLVFKKEHKLWQLPQGRINNQEEVDTALPRIVKEELGEGVINLVDFSTAKYVEFDQMEFRPGRHEMETLTDDTGREVPMVGKVYYFVALQCSSDKLDITKTQFDQYYWMSSKEAYFLAERIYQKGKRRITMKILDTLFKEQLIT